jgi:hypothetical protein
MISAAGKWIAIYRFGKAAGNLFHTSYQAGKKRKDTRGLFGD